MNNDDRRSLLGIIALIVALFAVLGHVCVLPAHAHAVPVEGHGSHDEDAADHSVHTASCEGLKSAAPMVLAAPAVTTACLVVTLTPSENLIGDRRIAAVSQSPPLFLLHAALLI